MFIITFQTGSASKFKGNFFKKKAINFHLRLEPFLKSNKPLDDLLFILVLNYIVESEQTLKGSTSTLMLSLNN